MQPEGGLAKFWDDFGELIAFALGAVGTAFGLALKVLRRRRKEKEKKQLEEEALRVALDGVRMCLFIISGKSHEVLSGETLKERLAITRNNIDEVREKFWVVTGHPPNRADPAIEELARSWRRTYPRVQDVLSKKDLEEDEF